MPLEIDGKRYFLAKEVEERCGISRQTLWRWRQSGQIPRGHRYRGKQLVFSAGELAEITEYANRLEPALPAVEESL
jgi:predicted DNA-binding transcriptional regulator AlpA